MTIAWSPSCLNAAYDPSAKPGLTGTPLTVTLTPPALIDREVHAVARALRQHGIEVTAIHNHGLADTPRLFYMHFWANDSPAKLAQGLKAALDQTNSQH